MTEEVKNEEIKCKRCRYTLPTRRFSKNRKGDWMKMCNECRYDRKGCESYKEQKRIEDEDLQDQYGF